MQTRTQSRRLEVTIDDEDYYSDSFEDETKLNVCATPTADGQCPVDLPSASSQCTHFSVGPDNPATTTYRLDGLENGTTYCVTYSVVDQAGNESPQSEGILGTPAVVLDFAEYYTDFCSKKNPVDAPVSEKCETGGCRAVDSSAPLGALFLFGLLAIRLRKG